MHASRTQPVRIGVVGFGAFGRLHALTLAGIAEAELGAVVDPRPERLAVAAAELPDVPRWDSLNAAVREADVEAWVVASATATHVAAAETLLRAGRPVLLEKPIASDLAEAERLGPLVALDSANLMLGHVMLFNSEFRCLREEVARRGRPTYLSAARYRPANTPEILPGESPFHLTMVHDLYCTLALLGREDPVRFSAQAAANARGECVLATAQLTWADGTLASLAAGFVTPTGMSDDGFDRMEVFGRGWACRIDPNPRPVRTWDERARWPAGLEIRVGGGGPAGMLAEQARRFCHVVRGREAVPLGAAFEDGLRVQRWTARLIEAKQRNDPNSKEEQHA